LQGKLDWTYSGTLYLQSFLLEQGKLLSIILMTLGFSIKKQNTLEVKEISHEVK